MSELIEWLERPGLDNPVLIVMLSGWIDTSSSAAAAIGAVETESRARTIARFDRDTFIDYRARRPTMEIREGVNSRLIWPDIELRLGTDAAHRSFLMLTGQEPDAAWERFAAEVISAGRSLGVSKMVGLGAYPFAAPHTRPALLSTTSPDATTVDDLPYQKSASVDVPAGILAVLEHAFHDAGIPALTLWAQVPHYVSAMTYPAASVALLDALGHVAGVHVDGRQLRSEAIVQRQRLDDLVAANDDHTAMLHQLEEAYDAQAGRRSEAHHPSARDREPISAADLPSGDELAAELERFLRDQDG